jgi:hypothetical protein
MNAAIRALFVRCGFTVDAATHIVSDQGINTLEEIRFLTDPDVERVIKAVRRPGGMIAAPVTVPPTLATAQINPGIPVSILAEGNLKLACYWLRLQEKMARTITPAQVVAGVFRLARGMRESDLLHTDPIKYPIIDDEDWSKTMDTIGEFLNAFHGESGIPLGYVIRKTVELPPGIDLTGNPTYATPDAEMIRRAPHDNITFIADNKKVWGIIASMTRGPL